MVEHLGLNGLRWLGDLSKNFFPARSFSHHSITPRSSTIPSGQFALFRSSDLMMTIHLPYLALISLYNSFGYVAHVVLECTLSTICAIPRLCNEKGIALVYVDLNLPRYGFAVLVWR
jgi:hypothetical protein